MGQLGLGSVSVSPRASGGAGDRPKSRSRTSTPLVEEDPNSCGADDHFYKPVYYTSCMRDEQEQGDSEADHAHPATIHQDQHFEIALSWDHEQNPANNCTTNRVVRRADEAFFRSSGLQGRRSGRKSVGPVLDFEDSTNYLYRLGLVLAGSASKDLAISARSRFSLFRSLVWLPLSAIGWIKARSRKVKVEKIWIRGPEKTSRSTTPDDHPPSSGRPEKTPRSTTPDDDPPGRSVVLSSGHMITPRTTGDQHMIRCEWIRPRTPRGRGKTHVIFYIHGGAFVLCDTNTHRYATITLVQLSECVLFSPNYRRPPDVSLETSIADCLEAYLWLLEDSGQDIRAEDVAFVGDSAGGALCIQVMLQIRDRGKIWEDAVVRRRGSLIEQKNTDDTSIPVADENYTKRKSHPPAPDEDALGSSCSLSTTSTTPPRQGETSTTPEDIEDDSSTREEHRHQQQHFDVGEDLTKTRPLTTSSSQTEQQHIFNKRTNNTSSFQNSIMPGRCVLVSPWVEPSAKADSSFIANAETDLFRFETVKRFANTVLRSCSNTSSSTLSSGCSASTTDTESPPAPARCTTSLADLVALDTLNHGFPPMLIITGDRELLRDQIIRFARKVATGNRVRFEIFEDMCHVFPALYGIHPSCTRAFHHIATFLHSEDETSMRL
ncbi:unnamed protein product [Amoebophrya sp. A25]|nr:unnamed protein product [Amoebophrya sp. A25]|eukprot:GSA25T00019125001.1